MTTVPLVRLLLQEIQRFCIVAPHNTCGRPLIATIVRPIPLSMYPKKQKKTFDTMKTGTGICAATPKLKQRHVLRRTIYITEQRPRCVSLLHGWGWGNVARAPRALYHPICPPINPYHAHLVSASSASSAVAPAAVCTSRTAPSASFSRAQRLASGLSVCGWGVSALSCACAVDHRDRAIHTTQRTGWTRISGHKGQGGRVLVSKQPATE